MEYSIKPKRLGERGIIHYPQKRIIGLYVIEMKEYQHLIVAVAIIVAAIIIAQAIGGAGESIRSGAQGRIEGAILKGNTWLIPENAEKPDDPRRVRKNVQNK